MTRTFTVNGADITDTVRLESFALVEAAFGGEVGQGGFSRADAVRDDVPAMKSVTVDEGDATPTLVFDGFIGVRGLERGHEPRQAYLREFDVTCLDLNTVLDDENFGASSGANRPSETDYARVTWLLTTGAISALSISAGVVPNTNTKTMDARDYRGEGPRAVLDECAEAAGKNYFVYNYGSGRKLYYDLATGTSLTSALRLSTVLADCDWSTTFPFAATPKLELDPSRIYSTVCFRYDGGKVWVTDADIEAQYRRREIGITDTTVKSAAKATDRANAYLAAVRAELHTFTASVTLPKEQVNDIRAGQRLYVKVPHLTTAELDLDSFRYMRISRRTVMPAPAEGSAAVLDYRYRIDLEFADDLKPLRYGGKNEPGANDAGSEDGSAVSLSRYQLQQEAGSGPFGPAVGAFTSIAPAFSFGTISAAIDGLVTRSPEGNISWPYTDCGVGTGGVAGLESRAVWHRFTVDLDDETLIGVRFTVAPFLATGSGYTQSPSGLLVGDGTVSCGIHTGVNSSGSEITDQSQYTEVGRVGDQGGSVFVPRSLLIDNGTGYNWFVLAPGWDISTDLFYCNSALKVWGYGKTGHDSNGSSIVSAVAVNSTGSGQSQWLPADGDVDGSNAVFTLPLWDGTGVPEVRVGAVILGAGEYTYDGSTLTVTLDQPPDGSLDGQVAYRAHI